VIIEQATGMSENEFARIHLFEPMEIKTRGWETVGGYNNGGAGLVLSAHEMARFGALYLNKGVYNGKRIVSEEWLAKALTPQIPTIGYGDYHYGFGWWLGTTSDSIKYAYALGWAGQYIFVVPELDLTVTATHSLDVPESAAVNNVINTRDFVVNKIIKHYKEAR
jgi:CubicO group peptidase (beta-lactamase class C family)